MSSQFYQFHLLMAASIILSEHNTFMTQPSDTDVCVVIQKAALTCLAGEEDGGRKVRIGVVPRSGVARSAE
jgi:hypothetical protein